MMSRWHWMLSQLGRRLWVRVALFVLLGIATALAGTLTDGVFPAALAERIQRDTVADILKILASSLLAVTTFSLGVMVSSYASVTSNVTPRAAKLLMEDRTSQNVLATFIGAFLFSLVGLIALGTETYGRDGRVSLFFITLLVLALVVLTLLRWIDHLARLGRVGETTRRVEAATWQALQQRLASPCLGGDLAAHDFCPPAHAQPIHATQVGYVQHVDTAALQQWAETHDSHLYVPAVPGTYVHPDQPLAWILTPPAGQTSAAEAARSALRQAFTVADERTFEQDPRFGLAVLAEIAARALSPAVNDPGTAIDVIGRQVRLLLLRAQHDESPGPEGAACPRVRLPALAIADLFDDAFTAIARDGAGSIEVVLRLVKGLRVLAHHGSPAFRQAAQASLIAAVGRAEQALAWPGDRDRLHQVVGGGSGRHV